MPGPPEDLAKDSTRSSKHGQSGRMPALTSTGHKSASRKRQADLPSAARLFNSETRSSAMWYPPGDQTKESNKPT